MSSSLPPINKESSSSTSLPFSADGDNVYEQYQEAKVVDSGRRVTEKESFSYNSTTEVEKQHSSFPSNYSSNSHAKSGGSSVMEKERVEVKTTLSSSPSQKVYSSFPQNSVDTEEKVQKVSPPRRKAYKDEKSEKVGNLSSTSHKQQSTSNSNTNSIGSRQYEPEPTPGDGINELLEVSH